MKVERVGHVVLQVRDRAASERFYIETLGMEVALRTDRMTFLRGAGENHHDLGLQDAPPGSAPAPENSIGVWHIALKIGTTRGALVEAKRQLDLLGIKVVPIDHAITESLYVKDPDGHLLELYVDVSDAWRQDPSLIAHGVPLDLPER
jgi:catechol 2,3-dioxygenase